MQDKRYIICGNAPTDGIKENPDRDLRLRLWGKDGPDRDQDGETGAVERVWGDGEYEQEIEMSKMDLMQCDWCFRNVATEDQQPRGWIWVLDGVPWDFCGAECLKAWVESRIAKRAKGGSGVENGKGKRKK